MMKRVRINIGRIGLVFRNGDYVKVITEGVYWMFPFDRIIQYDLAKPFYPSLELNILLRDKNLAEMLHVIEVSDNEIALQYQDGNFKNVLTSGRYTFWKGVTDFSFVKVDLSKVEITEPISKETLSQREVLPYVRLFVVESYEKGALFVDGRFEKILDAGTYYYLKNAATIVVSKIDMRQVQLEISGQEILTSDKVGLRVNFYTQYKVVDIQKALIDNKDYEKQLYILTQLALREFIGTLSLDELLERKESVSVYILNTLSDKAKALGVEIKDCGVRDVILPGEVKEIMSQVLIAQKKAQANVITRREETASTRSLLNTSKLMEDNEMLFKLKEMEYVEKIADKINTISLSGGNQIVDQLRDIFAPVR